MSCALRLTLVAERPLCCTLQETPACASPELQGSAARKSQHVATVPVMTVPSHKRLPAVVLTPTGTYLFIQSGLQCHLCSFTHSVEGLRIWLRELLHLRGNRQRCFPHVSRAARPQNAIEGHLVRAHCRSHVHQLRQKLQGQLPLARLRLSWRSDYGQCRCLSCHQTKIQTVCFLRTVRFFAA